MVVTRELLRRLGRVPEDDLVQALRRIHQGGPSPGCEREGTAPGEEAAEPETTRAAWRSPHGDSNRRDSGARSDGADSEVYERARRHFAEVERRLTRQALVSERVIEQLRSAARGASASGPPASGAPATRASSSRAEAAPGTPQGPDPEDHELVRLLREAQFALLRHPQAAQALFAAIVAEGRRFAATEEGRRWQERLAGSPLMRRGRAIWEVATLEMLEEKPATTLPSVFLEMMVKASEQRDLEPFLLRLYGVEPDAGEGDDESDSATG